MKHYYIKILRGCIALVVTIAGLYIGQALWQSYAVDLPLDKALKVIDGVETVTWDNGENINDTVNINILLNHTNNIKASYDEISNKIEETLKDRQYELNIQDNRSSELQQVYHDIHFYIEKAIVDGDFPLLDQKAQEVAAAAGAEVQVYVDADNIYIQLAKDDSALYSITARPGRKIGGNL